VILAIFWRVAYILFASLFLRCVPVCRRELVKLTVGAEEAWPCWGWLRKQSEGLAVLSPRGLSHDGSGGGLRSFSFSSRAFAAGADVPAGGQRRGCHFAGVGGALVALRDGCRRCHVLAEHRLPFAAAYRSDYAKVRIWKSDKWRPKAHLLEPSFDVARHFVARIKFFLGESAAVVCEGEERRRSSDSPAWRAGERSKGVPGAALRFISLRCSVDPALDSPRAAFVQSRRALFDRVARQNGEHVILKARLCKARKCKKSLRRRHFFSVC
jgi:hypothetical protein